tara:strand:- start:31802 stop:32080 length:279 start_codon:yes stop_codon:yes gene_type:complete
MAIIVKRKGHKEKFDEKKIYGSVYSACASALYPEQKCEKTANQIMKKIIRLVANKKQINSSQIRKKIEQELTKKDKELAFYYEQHLPNLKEL